MAKLKLENFYTGYNNKSIIKNINFSIDSSEWLSVIGPNGSGKSTLIKGILGITKSLKGNIYLKNKNIKNFTNKRIAQTVSFLPQQLNVNLNITVGDLVALGRSPYKEFWEFDLNKSDQEIINESLYLVDIYDLKDILINQISGGQCQRAYLAMALAQDPEILILDEPTNALDLKYQIRFLEIIKALKVNKKISVITILHDLNLAARYSDKIIALKNGESFGYGSSNELINERFIQNIFDINALISDTPYGKQIYPID